LLAAIRAHNPDIGLLTTHPTEGEFPFFAGSVELAIKLNLQAAIPADGSKPLIIPYNETIVYRLP
jgi:hypothetical protein